MELLAMVAKVIAIVSLLGIIGLLDSLILKPQRLRSKLRKQGIQGPPSSFLLGNFRDVMNTRFKGSQLPHEGDQPISHNCSSALFPFIEHCRKKYGQTFMLSIANMQMLVTTHPDFVKQISKCNSFNLAMPSFQLKALDPLLGKGILNSNGQIWAHHRKIYVPELSMEKVKGMMKKMADLTIPFVNTWNTKIESEGGVAEIKIDSYMESFTADVIVRACFGKSFAECEEIFLKLKALEDVLSKGVLLHGITGILRYLPTKSNREAWKLNKEIRTLILKVIKERKDSIFNRDDMLQSIIEGSKDSSIVEDPDSFIIDSCKNIYLAGYGVASLCLTWTLMLLALYPEWQEKVRAEVFQVCENGLPDGDGLVKMKTMTMVVNETLRLYSLVPILAREALDDMKFGDIEVPKGVNIVVPAILLRHDPDIWGPDADEFNPQRFFNGVSGACKYPQLYMPWGFGPHTCLGQHFALAIIKIILTAKALNLEWIFSFKSFELEVSSIFYS